MTITPTAGAGPLFRQTWFRVVATLAAVVLLAVLVLLAGPRNAFGPNTPTTRAQAPQDIAQLETWVRSSEATPSADNTIRMVSPMKMPSAAR